MRMKAAVYARKSTEQNVADDAKSVTRQVELARGFAAAKGWTVDKEHVYTDDGISGALATKLLSRARMLAAAANEEFSVLIVRDVDRLSRNDEELPGLVYTLRDAGVEIWCYGDGARVDTATALSRGMLSMRATFAAAEREAAQTRTREAVRSRAQKGHVSSGYCFGYVNIGPPKERRRAVNEQQAEVVRRIFQLTADGLGLHRICQTLNSEDVAAPSTRGWSRSSPSYVSSQMNSGRLRMPGLHGHGKSFKAGRKGRRAHRLAWRARTC